MSKVLLVGCPNSGKSLLFNRLTGLQQKVANFPGITVDICSGTLDGHDKISIVDFPGFYSTQAISQEERIAIREFKAALEDSQLAYVACIVDATRLEQGLYFTLQVIQACQLANKPLLMIANMMDTIQKYNESIDFEKLAVILGTKIIPTSAKTGFGLEALKQFLARQEKKSETESNHSDLNLLELDNLQLRKKAHQIALEFSAKTEKFIKPQIKLDRIFLNSSLGIFAFFVIMYLLFQSIFTWAAPAMDLVEASLGWVAGQVTVYLPNQGLKDFTNDALFGGIGAFLVFVPQIFVLTFIVGILEDSGYLARAAVICHRPLKFFGLTGKSFVPLLSGVACAIPGIYAARNIDSPLKRWLTYFAIPLMPCTARLPIYTLLIATFIPPTTALGGLIGLQGLALFLTYIFGITSGLLVTSIISRFQRTQLVDQPFVLEMPPYRIPGIKPLIRNSINRSKHFVTKAGFIIFVVTLVVWFLGYFPNYGADLGESWLASIGKILEPMIHPLGLDWKYGVAMITSFLAREVFVGTLGALLGIESADDNVIGLAERIQASGLSLASGIALIVFFALAMQCVSTLAILRRESGSWKLPIQIFLSYSALAYTVAVICYQILLMIL